MYKIFQTEIVILIQILSVFAENKTDVGALEKEKEELFKQINEAIDESVRALRTANDSEAALGITYMERLRDQLKDINGTSVDLEEHETRRRKKNKKLMFDMSEISEIFKINKDSKAKFEKDMNREEIQKKIDKWILQREMEKQKIREYKNKQRKNIVYEKCPRYGIANRKNKVSRRNENGKKKKYRPKKTRPKRPCCRKCCKKSYMGCL